jgi:uncharacterized protein (TIGR03089 family)
VTVLHPSRRDEQGVASLAQWAAKGAHLLELDLLLEPGDVLTLDVPAGWTAAAVALAAWWSGLVVDLDGGGQVAVVEEGRTPPPGAEEVLWVGGQVDGAPSAPVPGDAWVHAVQSFPDQPPPPRSAPGLLAVVAGDTRWTQEELLAAATEELPAEGTLGLDSATDLSPALTLAAVAVRPLVVGKPTVVLRGDDRAAAAGERVRSWR